MVREKRPPRSSKLRSSSSLHCLHRLRPARRLRGAARPGKLWRGPTGLAQKDESSNRRNHH